MKNIKITAELDKKLNERIRKILQEGTINMPVCVGWNHDCVFLAVYKKKDNTWHLKRAKRRPKRCATPKELDVDLGVMVASLTGKMHGTVSTMG